MVNAANYPAASLMDVKKAAWTKCCRIKNNAPDNFGANMEYLLKTIDMCNGGMTNYGSTPQATNAWANTHVVDTAFQSLLLQDTTTEEPYLYLPKGTRFNFTMDWGPGYKIEVKFKVDETSSTANVIFYNNCYTRFGFMAESSYWRADYLGNEMKRLAVSRDTNVHTIVKQDGNNWIDGVLYQNNNTAQTPFMQNCPITIGGHGNNDVTYAMTGRIYYAKIWDGSGNLLKHFMPALVSGNAVMYDILSDTVVNSAGSVPSLSDCN